MTKVKDKLWIWGHEAGSHDNRWGLTGSSRITPAEAAFYIGVPNIFMVKFKGKPSPPYDQYALALSPLKRVVWSISGMGGETGSSELEVVLDLARHVSNICGVVMDDPIRAKADEFRKADYGGYFAVYSIEELDNLKKRLTDLRLDLWISCYTTYLDLPNIEKILGRCDVLIYATWHAKDLTNLEQNLSRLEDHMPHSRKVLGCYMWDYGENRPMPLDLMQHQCNLGLKWLREGRIEGMVFVASCICDMGLEAVEWTRKWIQEVGNETLTKV